MHWPWLDNQMFSSGGPSSGPSQGITQDLKNVLMTASLFVYMLSILSGA